MIPILLYHRISPEPEPGRLSIPLRQFERQMASLYRAGRRCVGLDEVVGGQHSGNFSLTFDDGYRDNYELALPVLERYGFIATIFLVADRVGGTSDWDGESLPMLDWPELREMARSGARFGSHTRTHPFLDRLDRDRAAWEITGSKEVLEDGLGQPVDFFAYPYARAGAGLQALVAEAGYLGACGSTRLAPGRFNLWRAEAAAGDGSLQLAWKLSRWWPQMIQFKRAGRLVRDRLCAGV